MTTTLIGFVIDDNDHIDKENIIKSIFQYDPDTIKRVNRFICFSLLYERGNQTRLDYKESLIDNISRQKKYDFSYYVMIFTLDDGQIEDIWICDKSMNPISCGTDINNIIHYAQEIFRHNKL